jgi:hypothetical protein
MDDGLKFALALMTVFVLVVGSAIGAGMWNDQKVVQLIGMGVKPKTAYCVIKGCDRTASVNTSTTKSQWDD